MKKLICPECGSNDCQLLMATAIVNFKNKTITENNDVEVYCNNCNFTTYLEEQKDIEWLKKPLTRQEVQDINYRLKFGKIEIEE